MNKMTVVAGSLGSASQFGVLDTTANEDLGQEEQTPSRISTAASFTKLAPLLSTEVKTSS